MLRRSRIDEGELDEALDDEFGGGAPTKEPTADGEVFGDAGVVDAPPDEDDAPEGSPDLHGLRLLVVNDDPHSCELISRLVESLGCRARRVGSPEGIVAFIADPMNEIGGVVLDLRGGVAVSAAILEDIRMIDGAAGELPVAVLTSTADDPTAAWAAGADMFLARPFHANDFLHDFETTLLRSPDERAGLRDSRGAA